MSGGTVLLERLSSDPESARYAVTLSTPTLSVRGEVEIHRGGADALSSVIDLRIDGAPDWLVGFTRALCVTLAKRAKEEGWPRRVNRWRAEK